MVFIYFCFDEFFVYVFRLGFKWRGIFLFFICKRWRGDMDFLFSIYCVGCIFFVKNVSGSYYVRIIRFDI